MGVKRPFEEEFEEASFKQAKQLDSGNKLTSFAGSFSAHEVSESNDDRGEGEDDFDKSKLCKGLGDDDIDAASSLADKELETSAPLSWITSSSSEEDAGFGEHLYLPLFQEYFQFNFPRQTVVQLEDAYAPMLNSSPRRQVPIGPNHQADIPLWCPDGIQKELKNPNHSIEDENEQNMFGTSIFSLSDSEHSSFGDMKIGQGRKDCGCLDKGSMRCVQQHVKEARDKFRKVFGEEKFANLGFYDMGEDVAFWWTEEEERIFHEVIFSNPVSLGKNFWRHLSAVFPSRTKKELVSYYFNVFMLRRRAVQNRSILLEIDSDDDEWHGNVQGFDGVGEDEDSVVESFGNQDLQEGSDEENDDEGDDEESDDDDGSDDGEGDGDFSRKHFSAGREDAMEKHDIRSQISMPQCEKVPYVVSSECVLHNMVNTNHIMEDCGIQEASSTSSETQQNMMTSFGSVVRADAQGRENGNFNKCPAGESNGSNEGSESDSVFLLETYDPQEWDGSSSTGLVNGVDLLATCNMIEEIFGPCTSKSN